MTNPVDADDLPEPLVPADVDLRDQRYMPLLVQRLRDSATAGLEDPEAFRGAVLLWAAAWHQLPAASVPDDDRELARLAGYGRDAKALRTWKNARKNGALRGFVRCNDGRLYHRAQSEVALESWRLKIERHERTARATAAREAKRKAEQQHSGGEHPSDPLDALRLVERDDQRNVVRNVERDDQRNVVQEKVREGKGNINLTPPVSPPDGGEPSGAVKRKAAKSKRTTSGRITFDAFLERCKASGEERIPADAPVRVFAESVGIPDDFLRLAWIAFTQRHAAGSKTYVDWRRVFDNYVRHNWLGLWFVDKLDGAYRLTTAGEGFRRELEAKRAAREGRGHA